MQGNSEEEPTEEFGHRGQRRHRGIAPRWLVRKLAPGNTDAEEETKEADHCRLVSGRFDKQGNSHLRLVLGSCARWADICTRLPESKVSTEASTGFSHCTVQRVSAPPCSLKAVSLETASTVGTVGRMYIPRTGEGKGASSWLGPVHRSTSGHMLSTPLPPTTVRMKECSLRGKAVGWEFSRHR